MQHKCKLMNFKRGQKTIGSVHVHAWAAAFGEVHAWAAAFGEVHAWAAAFREVHAWAAAFGEVHACRNSLHGETCYSGDT